MSQQLISRSSDLKKLRDLGYTVEIRSGYLVVHDVPYVSAEQKVMRGTLASTLTLADNITVKPDTHVVYFAGQYPCHKDGKEIEQIRHASNAHPIDENLTANHSFSSKPSGGYGDYFEKMTTYIAILENPAKAIDPAVTAQLHKPILDDDEDSVFIYLDTASSRAGITMVTKKLELGKIAIVGVGGTGSYILDLVAKTPVREIHLFDGDNFHQHNLYRTPGVPPEKGFDGSPKKVRYFTDIYLKVRKGIVPHDYAINETTIDQLEGMDFVFLSIDGGNAKEVIIEALEKRNIPFVDTGMGINLVDDSLCGIVRLTTSTKAKRDHVWKGRISFTETEENEYSTNIQIAELNALNASLAVVRWKKLFGFYKDYDNEHHCTYTIDGNCLHNDDKA